MKYLHRLLAVASAAFFIAGSALAQNAGTVTNHAFAVGKGAGKTGYTSLLCGSAQLAVGQAAADPICRTITGDVTIDATGATAIGSNKVTNAQLRQSGALSLLGRSANSTGNVADISAVAASSCVFMENASALTCANIGTANLSNSAVTYAKIQNATASRLVGNPTGLAAAPSEISLGAALAFSGSALQTIALSGDVTSAANSFATTIAANAVTNAKLATMAANTLKGNATGSAAVPTDIDISTLTTKATPGAGDYVLLSDQAASGALKKATISTIGGGGSVTSVFGRTGTVVAAAGDYSVALGGTGTTNLIGHITGLQPLKLGGATIAVNPGTWANNTGTAVYNSTSVLSADLSTAVPSFASSPATGAQVSGALVPTANSTDGTEVFLYLIHRNSDSKVALIGSSSDTQGTSQTFTATAAAPGVITTPAVHGLRKRMAIYLSNSGGALPAPFGAATQYYVCTVPSTTTFTLATSIANVNSGSCLTTTTTGTGTNTAAWGVQKDIDFQLGAGVATFDRRLPYFAFVWSWTKYGNAGTPGGTNGIPDFQVAQGASDTLLTGSGENASFQVISGGAATSFTAIDFSPWLANLNRRVNISTRCRYASTIGSCYMRASGSGSAGLLVGAPTVANIDASNNIQFQTDSTTKVDYFVTGGALLTIYIAGWTFVDPS